MDAGDAEVRYLSGQSSRVLARRAIKILPPHVSLAAADGAVSGSVVSITWTDRTIRTTTLPSSLRRLLMVNAERSPTR